MDQVLEEEPFIAASEEEVIQVQYLLVEPQNDHALVDCVLCFHKNLEECMTMEDVPAKFGGIDPNATGEGEDRVQLKVLDGMTRKVELENLKAENVVFTTCEDYLIEVGFADSVTNLDYDLHLGNSGSESQIPGYSSADNGTLGISNSSTAIPIPECQDNLLEKTICDLYENVNSKCEFGTSVEAKWLECPCPTSSEPKNVEKLEDVSNLLVRGVSSDKIEKDIFFPSGPTSGGISYSSMIVQNNEGRPVGQVVETESSPVQDLIIESPAQDSNVGTCFTQKRMRKPTRRYIDESSYPNSRYRRKGRVISSSTSTNKLLGVGSLKHRRMGSRTPTLSSNESFGKAIQVPFGSQGRKECRKKHVFVAVRNTDMETSPDWSKKDSTTTVSSEANGGQRKHHKLWTLSEVRKLIDGISHYGVGRWAQIKRLLFSSSAHRTPVDLKDKWRNLLKASCAEEQRKKEDEQRRYQPWRPLPKSMLLRVSELAIIYPYPRDEKSKPSHDSHVSSPTHPARKSGSPLRFSRRVHKKNYT